MWSPTHVRVTVQRARSLRTKGRGATNDAFVVIQMGKEKFQTTVKEKCINPEWCEECDLTLLKKDANVVLTVFHRNLLGLDEFLGQLIIPIQQFESFDRPVNKWYSLKGKSGKNEEKYRGEIEVSVAFVVQSSDTQSLSEFPIGKNKRRNSLKHIATSVGHKIQKMPSRTFSLRTETFDPRIQLAKLRMKRHSVSDLGNGTDSTQSCEENEDSINDAEINHNFKPVPMKPGKKFSSIYSSTLSLPQSAMITTSIQEDGSLEDVNAPNEQPSSTETTTTTTMPEIPERPLKRMARKLSAISSNDSRSMNHDEWTNRISSQVKGLARSEMNLSDVSRTENATTSEKKSALESIRNTLRRHTLQFADPTDFSSLKINNAKRNPVDLRATGNTIADCLPNKLKDIPVEVVDQYEKMNHQDLVVLAIRQQTEVEKLRDKIADIETYLDDLLLRVMETTPRILQTPYKPTNPACSRIFLSGVVKWRGN